MSALLDLAGERVAQLDHPSRQLPDQRGRNPGLEQREERPALPLVEHDGPGRTDELLALERIA